MDFYYQGAWRMDWGLGNPNKTAALIALLIIGVWSAAWIWKRGFWAALLLSTALAWCLVQTYSRGGMVAALAGAIILLAWTPRPWPKSRLLAGVAAIWVVGAFVILAKAQERYGQGLFTEDQSINSRLIIWQHVPEMMAAAPWGWGWGKAGNAYTQWFQPPAQSMNYLNLVSSHFTWMVEGGWLAAVLYLFCGLVILQLCWPLPQFKLKAVPLAAWATFLASGCFSHIEESVWLWILPVIFLGYILGERFRLRQWPRPLSVGAGGLASIGGVTALVLIGMTHSSSPIHFVNGTTVIGRGPETTLIFVDRSVMGKLYGHTLRKFMIENPSRAADSTFMVTESTGSAVPPRVHQIILSGRLVENGAQLSGLDRSDRIILVNPECLPEEMRLDQALASRTVVYFGEYSQSPSLSSWSSYLHVKSLIISGASDFVPTWPEAFLGPHQS